MKKAFELLCLSMMKGFIRWFGGLPWQAKIIVIFVGVVFGAVGGTAFLCVAVILATLGFILRRSHK
ncbi:MAG: hypothetical protein NT019_01265 [Candidatus Adlerbacteria bacterium]|nr:hypothetical protein [Candidatus Adlerbacteria bacterium]